MSPTFAKLNLKDHVEIMVLNAPSSFEPDLKSLKGVTVRRDARGGDVGFAMAFAITQREVDTLGPQMTRKARGDAVVWFAYPKGSSKKYKSEINRDSGWMVMGKAGFEPVRMVAIDEDWSGALPPRRVHQDDEPAGGRAADPEEAVAQAQRAGFSPRVSPRGNA